MRKLVALMSIAAAAIALPVHADDSGFTLALRAGYGIPMGDAVMAGKLSDGVSGKIPLWVDAGYRIDKSIFVGAYFQYGLGLVNESKALGGAVCDQPGVSCSAYALRFGVQGIYNFAPDASFAPWAGLGIGYEIASLSAEQAGLSGSVTYRGFEFVNLQVGGDFKVSPAFSVGPYAAFSIGQFSNEKLEVTGLPAVDGSIADKATHEWLQFGVKGTFNL